VDSVGSLPLTSTRNLYANFSEEMHNSTITTDAFELLDKGFSTSVDASVAYAESTKTARLDSAPDLVLATHYEAVARQWPPLSAPRR
jgi:hypothetical protein